MVNNSIHSFFSNINPNSFQQLIQTLNIVLRWIEKQTGLGRPIIDNLQSILMANNLHIPLNDEISHFIGRLCFCQTYVLLRISDSNQYIISHNKQH